MKALLMSGFHASAFQRGRPFITQLGVMQSVDPVLTTKTKWWSSSYRGSARSNWVMKGRPRWKSEAWNPDINKAFMFYWAWDSWDECKAWTLAMQNGDLRGAYGSTGELLDFGTVDPKGISPE